MDLRNFIKESLVQIAQGIEDASEELVESSAMVNPRNVAGTGGKEDSKVHGYVVEDNEKHTVKLFNAFILMLRLQQQRELRQKEGLA